MSKHHVAVVAILGILLSQTACYTTKIITGRSPEGPAYTDRQWFTIGGLAPLSSPAGRECQNGISWAESKQSGTDILINIGLGVAGGIAGALACSDRELAARSSCASLGASLVPFLIGSRTVEYTCAAGPNANRPEWMPAPSAQASHAPARVHAAPAESATAAESAAPASAP
jgi:hypothetical protein